uniref:Uncharacterized protein n=1 Tax=Rhizophora mucronata TaxID=61149 RepID=A0A2P2NDU9_RHIMU
MPYSSCLAIVHCSLFQIPCQVCCGLLMIFIIGIF